MALLSRRALYDLSTCAALWEDVKCRLKLHGALLLKDESSLRRLFIVVVLLTWALNSGEVSRFPSLWGKGSKGSHDVGLSDTTFARKLTPNNDSHPAAEEPQIQHGNRTLNNQIAGFLRDTTPKPGSDDSRRRPVTKLLRYHPSEDNRDIKPANRSEEQASYCAEQDRGSHGNSVEAGKAGNDGYHEDNTFDPDTDPDAYHAGLRGAVHGDIQGQGRGDGHGDGYGDDHRDGNGDSHGDGCGDGQDDGHRDQNGDDHRDGGDGDAREQGPDDGNGGDGNDAGDDDGNDAGGDVGGDAGDDAGGDAGDNHGTPGGGGADGDDASRGGDEDRGRGPRGGPVIPTDKPPPP